MASLLTDTQKNRASQLIDGLADTYKRDITVINERANVIINDTNDDFNAMSDKKDSDITYTASTNTISARIKWIDKADKESELLFAGGQGNNNGTSVSLVQNFGMVRIKVEKQYEDLIKISTKIIVDEEDCQLFYGATPQSLFSLNYVVFYLTRQN